MKRLRQIFITALIAFIPLCLNAQLNIPKTIDSNDFNDNSVFISKDGVSISGNEISSGDGWGAFTIQLNGVPGKYSLEYCRNSYGKNNEIGLQESTDNQNWTDMYIGNPPTDWASMSGTLKPETRYIRFWYKASYKFGDIWFKYGYLRNFFINKAIYTENREVSASAVIGESASTTMNISVDNLKGDLIVECDNPNVTVTPQRVSRDEAIIQNNITFTLSYTPVDNEDVVANITFKDEGYEENYEAAKVTFHTLPSAPVANEATEITSTSFMANWEVSEGLTYLLTVRKDQEILPNYNELECEGNSMLVEGLEPNTTYTYTVKGRNGDQVSPDSDTISVTTAQPLITLSELEDFIAVSGNPVSQELTISTTNIIGDVILSLENDTTFSISRDTIPAAETNTSITVTYSPNIYGRENGKLTVSSEYADTIFINLTGINAPSVPNALEAEDITNSGFTARWEKVEEATDYLLTVLDENNETIIQYDAINTGDVDKYVVTNLLPTTTYSYYLQSVTNGTASEEISNIINVTTVDGAVISYSPAIKDFKTEVNTVYQQTLKVTGTNVFGDITLSIEGDESFKCDNPTLSPEGGLAVISFSPETIGTMNAVLVLSAPGAEDIEINLNGLSTPGKVEALNAENISATSFTAKWNEIQGAEKYLLSVYKSENILESYNNLEINSNSYEISSLEEATYYNYTVKAVGAGTTGEASDRISVRTLFTPNISILSEGINSITINWNEPYKADRYFVTLKKENTVVEGYDNKETESSVFTFQGLETGVAYSASVTAQFGETKISSPETSVRTIQSSSFGKQLSNSGFENWEGSGDTYEPVSWNSFGTGTGSQIGTAVSFGGTHMSEGEESRPGSTGSKSVKIWTASVFGVKANGNLTTGRINAGAMSASDPQNYNFTDINDDAFNQRLGAKPDSITVWVKYTSANAASRARVSAIIHDNYSYRDPSASDPEASNHIVATAESNFPSNGGVWQRLSIPFTYKGNDLTPDFMLVSFTSNMTPGGGDANDAVIIDDMHLIYKPTLKIGNISKRSFIPGETVAVSYEITGTMSAPNLNLAANTVSLQISDSNGSFASARTLATVETDMSGAFTTQIPADMPAGEKYKFRVVTTNYPMVAESGISFSISEDKQPRLSYTGNTSFEANIGGASAKNTLTIKGENINGDIFVKVDSKSFSISKDVLPSEGEEITVTYTPTIVGEEEAEMTIYSNGVESIVIKLHGTANAPTSIYWNESNDNEISIYPNPVIDTANISGAESDSRYCIYNIDGQMLKSGRLVFNTVDVSELPNGIFFIIIDNKKIKFVK